MVEFCAKVVRFEAELLDLQRAGEDNRSPGSDSRADCVCTRCSEQAGDSEGRQKQTVCVGG